MSLTFERTSDMHLVRRIITTPQIYRMTRDSGSPAVEDYEPVDHPAIHYVTVHDADELLGLFAFLPENGITWDVHTCLLPSALLVRGRSVEAARGVIQWVFANTHCLRIITHVPEFNRLALRFARQAGMIEFGFNVLSFERDGKLYGQHLLGISKGD